MAIQLKTYKQNPFALANSRLFVSNGLPRKKCKLKLSDIHAMSEGQVLWDTEVTGLHIKAHKTGKSFYLYYRAPGTKQQRRPKLGDSTGITIKQARELARDRLYRVAQGVDPEIEREERRDDLTVKELFNMVWDEHWNTDRYRESNWSKNVASHYARYIGPSLGDRKLHEVTPKLVRAWHESITKTFSANRALAVLKKMFSFAEDRELKTQNTNPCLSVKLNPERKRGRYASMTELACIGEYLEEHKESNPKEVAFIYTVMYSAARPFCIEKIKWADVRDVGGSGVVEFKGKNTSKSGDNEMLILPPTLFKLLKKLHTTNPHDTTLVGGRYPRCFWEKLCKECGVEGLWLRDLRRTFATIGLSGGVELGAIGAVLNHKSVQTTLIYAKLNDDARIATVGGIAEKISLIIGGDK